MATSFTYSMQGFYRYLDNELTLPERIDQGYIEDLAYNHFEGEGFKVDQDTIEHIAKTYVEYVKNTQ